jgi:hypothetical protein
MESSNFNLLKERWPKLCEYGRFAERYVYSDPHAATIKLRCFSELLVGILYRELMLPCSPNDGFFEKLKSSHFEKIADKAILEKLHAIRQMGNRAAHGGNIKREEVKILLKDAYLTGKWIYKTYSGAACYYPDYQEPQNIEGVTQLLQERNVALSEQLKSAKEELARLEISEQLSQDKAGAPDVVALDERFEKFSQAARASAESFDLAAGSTREIISLNDSFAGYQLTGDQSELVAHLTSFLKNKDEGLFLLKGFAGTGKTFITKGLTEYFRAIGRNYVLAAPTGKASKVIANKTKSEAYTIHKSIYSFKDIVEYREKDLDGSETYKFYAQLAINEMAADTVFIVDEASMVSDCYQEEEFFRFGSGYMLRDFLKYVNLDHNDHRKKVIFIGDDAQLPPVGMKFSPALDQKYLLKEYGLKSVGYELTDVVRQKADSGVMKNAIMLREALQKNVFNKLSVDLESQDVEEVTYPDLLERYILSCSGKINAESIVIAYSNSDVAAYNRRIREHFFPNTPLLARGDKVMAVKNSYLGDLFVSNGDFGLIRQVLGEMETRNRTLRKKNPETGKIEETIVPLSFRDVEIGFKDLHGDPRFFGVKVVENLLYSDHAGLSSDERKALYVDFCIRHPHLRPGSLEFKETLRTDPDFNAMHLKFGYAITCHKAQGSEWNHVFVKCETYQNRLTAGYFRWFYTACTRTANKLYLLDPPRIQLGSGMKMSGMSVATPPSCPKIGPKSEITENRTETGALKAIAGDSDNFGIPEGTFPSLEILNRIRKLTAETGVSIQSVDQKQYQESYFFQRDKQIARVVIYYNGKNKITRMISPNPKELSNEILDILKPLNGAIIVPEITDEEKNFEFAEDFLNEFHARLAPLMEQADIQIAAVKQLDWKQRYTFVKAEHVAVIDFAYDGKSNITNFSPVRSDCSSDDFIMEIASVLKGLDD